MKEHEQGIQFVESILDKEHEELSQSKRQHHTNWDNHILTLSTASIGFTFTFLPINSNNCFFLLVIGISSFILSICFTAANYIVADIGLNNAFDDLIKKMLFNTKLKQELFKLNKASAIAESENNEAVYKEARAKYDIKVGKLFKDVDFDTEIKSRDSINKKIVFLNHAKTYAFISGILFIVIFSFLNIEAFDNNAVHNKALNTDSAKSAAPTAPDN